MFPGNLLSCIDYPTLSFTSIKFQKFLLPPKTALSKILLPTLKTNPFLKVPDLFCRLHLPTLLYRPEAWNKQYVHSTYPHLEKHADKFATELLGFLSKVGSSQDLESKVAQDFHETGRGKPRRTSCCLSLHLLNVGTCVLWNMCTWEPLIIPFALHITNDTASPNCFWFGPGNRNQLRFQKRKRMARATCMKRKPMLEELRLLSRSRVDVVQPSFTLGGTPDHKQKRDRR